MGYSNESARDDVRRSTQTGDPRWALIVPSNLHSSRYSLGPKAAHTATAHKTAVIFYTMVKNQVEYDQTIWEKRDEQRRQRHTARLKRQAERLGYQLIPIQEENAT